MRGLTDIEREIILNRLRGGPIIRALSKEQEEAAHALAARGLFVLGSVYCGQDIKMPSVTPLGREVLALDTAARGVPL